ncbi:MAG: LPS-assembly protein LptD [Pelistega sp.]|nr:LPS-assembly protein LptD [Pelistega sp.]
MQKILGFSLLLLMPTVGAQTNSVELRGLQPNGLPRLQESPLLTVAPQNRDDITTFTDSADIKISDDNNRVVLTGGAQVRRSDAILKGDTITYNRATGEVEATGNARLLRDGSVVRGPGLKYNVDKQTGMMTSPVYRIANGGSGEADYAEIVDNNHMRLGNATYSACNCDTKFWYIHSDKVDLYNDENEGIAEDGTLYIKGVPVLWSPYFSFPIKREKKTGWLFPTFSSTSRAGVGFSVPYFINLAPNYDLTLIPQIYSKRGVMLGAEFRYLQPGYGGQLSGTFMPRDSKLDSKRWTMSWIHRHDLGQFAGFNFGLNVGINAASDTDYHRDFSDALTTRSDRTFLSKNASITFNGYRYWSGYLSWQKYQGLHDFSGERPIYYYQYEREPELMIRGARYDWNGFDVSTQNTYTRFTYPINKSRYPLRDGVQNKDGERFVSYTQVSYPIVRSGWYITPKVGLHMSHYNTDWYKQYRLSNGLGVFRSQADTQYSRLSRVLPIASIDAGMTFERETTLFGKPRLQTLEPRLYYVYIPYRYQDDIPVYDTSLAQFNMGTAFTENRYVGGWDRINDANQVTLGLTSRWLDMETGNERMVAQIAQRFYLQKPKVALRNERVGLENRSEFLGNLSVAVTDKFNTEVGVQLDTYNRKMAQGYASIRWFPKRLTSLSLTYRYQRDPFYYNENNQLYGYQLQGKNNISVAGQWPITENLYMVGRHDYSIKERRSTQSIIGMEYKGDCCWTSRVVFQRYAVSKEKTNTSVFFQLELTGLGAVGSDPMELLRDSIPGYQNIKDPKTVQSPFERYE